MSSGASSSKSPPTSSCHGPETELIVEEAIAFAAGNPCRTVLDVGTGSGCIAVAVAHELDAVHVIATDRSEAALRVAHRNAARLGVGDVVSFVQADLFDGVHAKADLILSNPPYVPERDTRAMQPEVVRFEPHEALFGGTDGMTIIHRLLRDAPARLAPGGRLVLEFGFGQEYDVRDAAAATGWSLRNVRDDIQGIPRTIVLTREVP